MARRSGEHSRRPRQNPDRRPVETAEGASSIARLYQHRGEHDGHHSRRHVQRQTLAGCWYALRWVAAGMVEANKGFLRLKAHKQLSALRAVLQAHHDRITIKSVAHVTRAA